METATIASSPFKRTSEIVEAQVEEPTVATAAAPDDFDPLGSPFGAPEDDDNFSFDLTGQQSQALIPAEKYIGHVVDVVKGQSQAGNPMWIWTFEILRLSDGGETPFAGRTLKKHCAITPAAMGIFTQVIEALGLGEAGKPINFSKKDAVNRLCYFAVTHSVYNGTDQANIGGVFPYKPIGQKYTAAGAGM